jgi:hypothetical protein
MRKTAVARILMFASGLALFASTGAASTYYVDAQRGNNANGGTADSPWQTIQKAADSAQPGDTILVAEGDYPERIQVTRSGVAQRPISFEARGKALTEGFTIVADYIRVVGFEITSQITLPRDSYGVSLQGQYDEIVNNYIHDIYHDGIMVGGPGHHLIKGNRIYRANNCGISVSGRENLIEDNEVSHTIQYPTGGPAWGGADADGMRFFGSDNVFRGNHIHDIVMSDLGNLDPHIDCFQTWGPATNMTFEQNVCDLGGSASMIENSSGAVHHLLYRNNIFIQTGPLNIHNNPARGNIALLQVLNNTFYRLGGSALFLQGDLTDVTIENNAFFDVGGHRQSYLSRTGASQEGWTVGYNLQSMSDGQPPGGSQATHPHDLVGVDPQFVNAAAKDFRPTSTSPLVDSGVELKEVKTDIAGKPRPQGAGYDIGAYEYQR